MEGDAHLEEFWLSFKQSMINFYKDHSYIKRPIDLWSQQLNIYQSRKKYQKIEESIHEFMSLYAMDVIRFGNFHTAHILDTNIKRWNRIRSALDTDETSEIRISNRVLVLFKIFYNHYDKIQDNKSVHDIYSQIELFLITDKYYSLIQFAIDYEYPSILDQLHHVTDLSRQIQDYYDLTIPKNMSGRKIIDFVKTREHETQFLMSSQ